MRIYQRPFHRAASQLGATDRYSRSSRHYGVPNARRQQLSHRSNNLRRSAWYESPHLSGQWPSWVVPLMTVLWPAAYDQVQTALAFSNNPLRIGDELKQIRNGYNIGRRTACGILVEGTDMAIRHEFAGVFGAMQGQLGHMLRGRITNMRDEMKEDMKWGGSHRALQRLLEFREQA